MSIAATVKAMAVAGLSAQQISDVVNLMDEERRAKNRAGNAKRQAEFRARRNAENAVTGVTSVTPAPSSPPDKERTKEINPPIIPQSSLRSVSSRTREDFGRFWSIYPRRQNKATAVTRWQTAVKRGIDPERIIAGAVAYAEWVRETGTEPRFVKTPDAWLNAGKWDDELPQIGKKNGGPTKYDLWAAKVEREAEEENRDNEQIDSGDAGEESVLGPDGEGEVSSAGGRGHTGPFDRGTGPVWRGGPEGRGIFHHSDPEISDMADRW